MNIRADLALIERIAAILAPYRDDEDLFLTTLDGETDLLDLIDAQIEALHHDDALAEAIKARVADYKARADRIEMRAHARKLALKALLDAAGMRKVERPLATVSIRPGSLAVQIADEAEVPSQLMREKVTRAPDRAAIRAQIEAGADVPGCALVRGEDVVSVRVR